ncbi:tRNA (guanosine(37)-N1)-methyltransferase TrmD [Candidatus Gottesmanbacteria bacterium RIFCSPLOWO2_01_FULL_46_21]|uniref:tRNA (guanine-N(1)-)-methyltransferase n=1 Tax=Candidatus Gottesmanbacteria bacterium RIFCSPLOWO2_01_FULL_46_21 TaxID=1798393 RepID=A0A1F6AZM5_9BACT|nr:MAG: tRNA (guanosine(37)-N1)-methyltransferase TrmD [Candidatus Gottesmanbacteria bacterium RIFCSPLOWO2_01_FULL_46_21]
MQIKILTLFPEMFAGPFEYSIIKRAQEKKIVSLDIINIRDFALDRYKTVDDHPYGGGQGMIMRVDIIDSAISNVKSQISNKKFKTILLDPIGIPYTQKKAQELSELDNLILVCGHYEGVDERIRGLVDEQISIGDYILSGGEIPTMILVDSIVRLVPGVLRDAHTSEDESFSSGLLEYPQYTRPDVYKDRKVPEVLRSGNHKQIESWKKQQAKTRTGSLRPDLLRE